MSFHSSTHALTSPLSAPPLVQGPLHSCIQPNTSPTVHTTFDDPMQTNTSNDLVQPTTSDVRNEEVHYDDNGRVIIRPLGKG